uniref:Uncharacterized protein n=1 Tax=Megaselia scalaris TaxID=36166 RepID=T1GIW7_MEGSC
MNLLIVFSFLSLILITEASSKHTCDRVCSCDPSTFKLCKFNFRVHYSVMASEHCGDCRNNPEDCENENCIFGDGNRTQIIAINNIFPGPKIKVCEGDTIEVKVKNELLEETIIHWHGILQKKTPWMDGTPYVNQYPINPGMTYTYKFETDGAGTFLYHSHMNFQRAYGYSGPLIVECQDYTVYIHDLAVNLSWTKVRNVFINGKAGIQETDLTVSNKSLHTYSDFQFHTGECYILRLIPAFYTNFLAEFSIDSHNLTVFDSDGVCIEPVQVESILLNSGERFSVKIEATKESGWYWIRVRSNVQGDGIQGAIIKYNGEDGFLESFSIDYILEGPQFNVVWDDRLQGKDSGDIPIINARSCEEKIPCNPEKVFYMTFDERDGTLVAYDFSMDDIFSQHFKNLSLLQTQGMINEKEIFCNKETLRKDGINCTNPNRCECHHMIFAPCNTCIEMVFTSPNFEAHSIHLHGYKFFVVGQGYLSVEDLQKFQETDKVSPYPRQTESPLLKDTFLVPAYGYGIIRFFTDNPGYWILHCHMEAHLELGKYVIIKICEHEDMLDPPEIKLIGFLINFKVYEVGVFGKRKGKENAKLNLKINIVDANALL